MSKKIYLDTNIYIDYFEGRVDNLRPLGEFAYELLRKTFSCEFFIVISTLVLKELTYNGYEEQIKILIEELKKKEKIQCIELTREDKEYGLSLIKNRKTPHNDTFHVVLAQKAKAEYVVTRNLKDFIEMFDLIEIALPENL